MEKTALEKGNEIQLKIANIQKRNDILKNRILQINDHNDESLISVNMFVKGEWQSGATFSKNNLRTFLSLEIFQGKEEIEKLEKEFEQL